MHECPHPVDPSRKKRRILVIGLHHEAATLEIHEVLGERQRYAGPTLAESGIGHRIFAELRDERDARVLDSPQLLGVIDRVREKRRL
jgi:hypothetical protein